MSDKLFLPYLQPLNFKLFVFSNIYILLYKCIAKHVKNTKSATENNKKQNRKSSEYN